MIVERVEHIDDLRRLTDALPSGLVHFRRQVVAYCNETFARMVGAPADEVIGRRMLDLIAPEHADRVQFGAADRQRSVPSPERWELDLVRADGSRVRVEVEPRTIGPDEHLVVVRDVGGVLHELTLANQLSTLALRMQRERSVDAILQTVVEGASELGFQMHAFQYEHGGDGIVIRAVAPGSRFARRFEEAAGRPLLGWRVDVRPLAFGPDFANGSAIFVDDTSKILDAVVAGIAPAFRARLLEGAAKRALVTPIVVGGRKWGGLFIVSDELHRRVAATLALFGAQVAGAIEIARTIEELDRANRGLQAMQEENARLYDETRRRLDLLSVQYGLSRAVAGWVEEGPLADRALGVLTERLRADAAWLYVSRGDGLEFAGCRLGGEEERNVAPLFASNLALDERTVCGRCAVRREAVAVELGAGGRIDSSSGRALGMRYLHAVPLVVEDRLVGTLTLARRSDRFEDDEKQLVESLAVQLAVALERTRLFAEQRRQVRDLSLLNELGNLFSQHLDLPTLLSIGVEHVTRLVDVPQVFLSLLEPGGRNLRVVASNLREPGVLDISLPRDGASAAAAAVRELRPVLIEDPLQDPRSDRAQSLRFGHRLVLAAPLVSRGEAIGALSLAETRPGVRFTQEVIDRAVAVANQLAAAVANARLFEEERERVRELSLLSELGRIAAGTLQREVLLSECLDHIGSALHFDAGAAWVTHRGQLERVATSGAVDCGERFQDLARRALDASGPIWESAAGCHACAVPLLAGPDAGGVLVFARRSHPVTEAELRTLTAAAPELGVALQNARLFDAASRRVEELRLLLDIGRAITGSLDLDSILETSAATLSRFTDGSNAFVLLLDPMRNELRGAACSNPAWRTSFRKLRISMDEPDSITAEAMRTRAPVAVTDARRSRFADNERVRLYGEKSVLAVPLLVRDEPIGCVLVDDTRRVREWSPAEIERATLIAHQVAVAVANAHLYDDLKRSYGELARTQEELVKRERLAALGELAAVVAHEVRNPLGVIFNSLGSLRKLLRPTGDGKMLLDIVEEEADRLDRIVRDLLDFARPNEPALEAERIDRLLVDTLQALQGDRVPENARVELELPPDLPAVRIDARMIRQVLLNLVLNGLQAMPRGGVLRIRGAEDAGGRTLRLEFVDQGTGVPAELAGRIFEPFFTTKAAGTGLGLAVVKRFVEAHRGSIEFSSQPGRGTTFTLRLPIDATA